MGAVYCILFLCVCPDGFGEWRQAFVAGSLLAALLTQSDVQESGTKPVLSAVCIRSLAETANAVWHAMRTRGSLSQQANS